MKRNVVALLAFFVFGFGSWAQEAEGNFVKLPNHIQEYVVTHFPDQTIRKSEVEVTVNNIVYDVKLQDGTELEFTKEGKLMQIESKKPVKEVLLPAAVVSYVQKNYPNQTILEWELEDYKNKQEVKLDNGVELEFDLNGKFIKID